MTSKIDHMYTLGQNGTIQTRQKQIFVSGNGSDISNDKALKGRAKRKTITQAMILSLMDAAKQKGNDEKQNSYWNTYYCQNRVIINDGKLYGKYCKNRFCTLCCSNRKAEIINKYLPTIKQWNDPYFVTLTIKSCKANRLKLMITKVLEGFSKIQVKYKKRYQRGNSIKLIGVKSLECNFNPKTQTYNPHLHLIVADKETAELLIKEWLLIWNQKGLFYASRKAQDMRKLYNAETGLIEIIKYGTKIFTEPDMNKRGNQNSNYQIYVSALDNILTAMKGKRIFERFGFNVEKQETISTNEPKVITDFEEWEFNPKVSDWENVETEKRLSGYIPNSQLTSILNSCINTSTQ
jgi:plasmid rolling circle replication initiator protein Rep